VGEVVSEFGLSLVSFWSKKYTTKINVNQTGLRRFFYTQMRNDMYNDMYNERPDSAHDITKKTRTTKITKITMNKREGLLADAAPLFFS